MTLLVLLVDNIGTLLVPTMLANMVNTGITTGDVDYILRNGLYMFIATSMASGGTVLGCYLSARLAANVACDIRNAVYDKSLELAASDFERFGTGSMITRSLNDINVIQQAILQTIQLVLPVPFLAVAGIIFAWFIDPAMGTLLGVVVAIVLVAAVFTVANAAPIFMRLQGFIDRMNVVLRENIVGVRVIRAFNKERHEERRLDEVFSEYAANAIKVNHLFVGLDSSSFFLMNIAEVAVLWVGGNRVGAHAMQIASISAVLEYAILILFFVMMAQMVVLTLPRAAACLNRAQQVLEIEPSIVDGERTLDDGAREPQDEADAVAVFDHMSFRFDDADEDTLCDLSFACRRGQTTAIVGSTGSGNRRWQSFCCASTMPLRAPFAWTASICASLRKTKSAGALPMCRRRRGCSRARWRATFALVTKARPRATCFTRLRLPRAPLYSTNRRGSIPRLPRAVRTFRAVSASVWQSPVRS